MTEKITIRTMYCSKCHTDRKFIKEGSLEKCLTCRKYILYKEKVN